MKRQILLFSVLLATLLAPFARAEGSLTDVQLNSIRTNCLTTQINLQKVLESDKRTRIDRGSRYEALLRLMTSFNSRVAQNKVDAPKLITIASEYQKDWEAFRAEYNVYDDGLVALIRLDCQNQPTTFYDRMVVLRTERNGLRDHVKQFDSLLDQYQEGVDVIKGKLGAKQ